MIFYSQELMHKYLANIGDIGYTPSVGAAVGESPYSLTGYNKFKFPVGPTLNIAR